MEDGLLVRKEESSVWGCYGDLTSEARRLGYLAGPMVGVTLSQYLVQVVSSMMVGHLGELELSSAAIATSLAGVTGFSLLNTWRSLIGWAECGGPYWQLMALRDCVTRLTRCGSHLCRLAAWTNLGLTANPDEKLPVHVSSKD